MSRPLPRPTGGDRAGRPAVPDAAVGTVEGPGSPAFGRLREHLALTWRQYRLERKMFWRNPSAAFFNFALPLLFLAAGGAILSGNQQDLNKLVPSIAGMSVMSTTFT